MKQLLILLLIIDLFTSLSKRPEIVQPCYDMIEIHYYNKGKLIMKDTTYTGYFISQIQRKRVNNNKVFYADSATFYLAKKYIPQP